VEALRPETRHFSFIINKEMLEDKSGLKGLLQIKAFNLRLYQ
jgi:hypothetical protein